MSGMSQAPSGAVAEARSRLRISAYVPCYNNQETITAAVESIRNQSIPVDELFVVDDGSTDNSVEVVKRLGIQVVSLPVNAGRGAVRAKATEVATGDLILSLDATMVADRDFLAGALPWFEEPMVAGVFGRITQGEAQNAMERWRGRHLYRLNAVRRVHRRAPLKTGAAVMRRSALCAVGNYKTDLRHSEDAELGTRLLHADWDVVSDPDLTFRSILSNTLAEVLERYWRWNVGVNEQFTLRGYMRLISYSVKVMWQQDMAKRDFGAGLISLILPHYFLYRYIRAPKRRGARAVHSSGEKVYETV